jgi:hypothetical protein
MWIKTVHWFVQDHQIGVGQYRCLDGEALYLTPPEMIM